MDETCSFLFSNVYCTSASRILEGIRISDLSDVAADFDDMRFPVERWETHEEVMERYTTGTSGKFNYLNMYIILSQDVHPPLYYFFLNTFSSFFPKLSVKFLIYMMLQKLLLPYVGVRLMLTWTLGSLGVYCPVFFEKT